MCILFYKILKKEGKTAKLSVTYLQTWGQKYWILDSKEFCFRFAKTEGFLDENSRNLLLLDKNIKFHSHFLLI